MTDFLMPKLGADMSAGTLVAWRKRPGDGVRRGDIVAEVDTDKGIIDIEAFHDGVLEEILVQPGAKVPVGAVLAHIRGAAGAPAPAVEQPRVAATVTAPPAAVAKPTPQPAPVELTAEDLRRLRISPSARIRARELGVDPRQVQGTGRGGAITREDIERTARVARDEGRGAEAAAAAVQVTAQPAVAAPMDRAPPPAPSASSADRAVRMRQAIAAAMTRANREIPHYYVGTTVDLHAALTWLAGENEKRPVSERLLYGALLLKATALALREMPELNAFWVDDRAAPQDAIHLGVAISLRGGGLVAPALHAADRLSLDELMSRLRDLVQRARTGGMRSSELSDPTATVTSLGEQGVEAVWGVIYPPQVALIGFGKIVERPWCVAGQVVARPVVVATLAGDHRATDGHRGGLFLAAIDRLLQQPDKL